MTFSVYFPYLCGELVKPRFASSKVNSTQSCALCTRKNVSMNLEQLVQNVHRSFSCAISQLMLHSSALCPWSTKAKNREKHGFGVI